jgi:Kdo2-lipid IVA lauroyltransferase/acyltransferase
MKFMAHNKRRKRSRLEKKISNLLEYGLLRAAIFIARGMPVVFLRKSAMWLFSVVQIRRKIAEDNLKMVFPEMSKAERVRILKEMYRNLGLTAVESYLENADKVFEKMEFVGWEEVEKIREKGRGVIVVSGHVGNFEMGGRLMAHQAPLCVIVKKQSNPYFDRYANRLRLKENCEPIQPGNALRPVLKKLKQNGLVVMMVDQNARYGGYQLDFLGHKASTHVSAAKIAIRTKTTIIISGITRGENGYPLLKQAETIYTDEYENNLAGHIALSQRLQDAVGKLVKADPEHWFWVHNRWKNPHLGKPVTETE